MLIAFCGSLGAGKTLGLTWYGNLWHRRGYTIYSNYKLSYPFKPITCLEDIEDMSEGFACLDELWLWMDARMSATKRNKAIAQILLKSRKRDISIGFTTQAFRQVDVRMRHITDYLVMPELISKNKWCILRFFENPPMRPVLIKKFPTAPVFGMYDTKEEIGEIDEDD